MSDPKLPDVLSALELQVADYRNRHKIGDGVIEVELPRNLAEEAISRYGSLDAAAQQLFYGKVRFVDRYWRDFCLVVTERVNQRLARRWPRWRAVR